MSILQWSVRLFRVESVNQVCGLAKILQRGLQQVKEMVNSTNRIRARPLPVRCDKRERISIRINVTMSSLEESEGKGCLERPSFDVESILFCTYQLWFVVPDLSYGVWPLALSSDSNRKQITNHFSPDLYQLGIDRCVSLSCEVFLSESGSAAFSRVEKAHTITCKRETRSVWSIFLQECKECHGNVKRPPLGLCSFSFCRFRTWPRNSRT